MAQDLTTFDMDDIYVPTADVLQQIDSHNLMYEDDLGDHMDEALLQDIGVL